MQRYLGQIVTQLLHRFYYARDPHSALNYVETGTIRDRHPIRNDPDDARSTLAVARWAKEFTNRPRRARIFSVDTNETHLKIAAEVLGEEKLSATFLCGTLKQVINLIPSQVDFVLLDSAADPAVTYEEFKLLRPLLRQPEGAIVVIDDIGRNHVNKGEYVLERMDAEKRYWKMVGRFIAAIPFGPTAEKVVREFK